MQNAQVGTKDVGSYGSVFWHFIIFRNVPNLHAALSVGTSKQFCSHACNWQCKKIPVHIHTLSGHETCQQRVRTHATQGGNILQDTPKDDNRRRKEYVWHHNDVPAHMEHAGNELVCKTVRSVLADLISHCLIAGWHKLGRI